MNFEQMCKEHGIKVMSTLELIAELDTTVVIMNGLHPNASYAISDKDTHANKRIALSEDASDAVKYHELGHFMHPLGGKQSPEPENELIYELAASAWALMNADIDAEGKEELQRGFKTYLDDSNKIIEDKPEYRELARIVGVEHWITWK